jgi:cell wall-associated NlpC family hydrolase
MAGADQLRDAMTARVVRPAVALATAVPAWARLGATTLAALGAAAVLAPAPAPAHHASLRTTFYASDWLGLTQPLLPSLAPPAGGGAPAGAPSALSAPGVPIACTSGTHPVAADPLPMGGPTHIAPAAYAVTVPAPVGAVLADASSTTTATTTTTDPLASALAGVSGVLNGVVGALGGATSGAAAGANPLQSVLQTLSPTTTTTTATPGANGRAKSGNSSASSAPPSAAGQPSTAAATGPGLSPAALAPPVPGPSSDIGCALIGAGSVGTTVTGESPAQVTAVDTALSLLGTPYVWGGESKGGFDCSGLVQYSFSRAGVSLPRVAQDQYNAGPIVLPGSVVVPGDLVFFGSGPRDVRHVGMFVGDGLMVDAPHTGAVVRLDRIEGFAPLVGVASPGGHQIA